MRFKGELVKDFVLRTGHRTSVAWCIAWGCTPRELREIFNGNLAYAVFYAHRIAESMHIKEEDLFED